MQPNQVGIVISAEDRATKILNDVKDSVEKVAGGFSGIGNRLKEMGDSISSVGKSISISGGMLFGAVSLVSKASLDAETSWLRVANRVKIAGLSVEDSVPKIKAFATQMQNATGESDELVGEFASRLLPITKDVGLAFEGTKAALSMAAQTGRDLSSVQTIMTMAMSGNIEALKRYIPEIRNLDAEQTKTMTAGEKVAFALNEIKNLYGDISDVPVDPLKLLKNVFGDLFEEIGLGREDIIRYINIVKDHINQVKAWVVQNKDLVHGIIKIMGAIGGALLVMGSFLFVGGKITSMLGTMITLLGGVAKGLAVVFSNPVLIAVAALAAIIGIVVKKLYEFGQEVGGIRNAWHLAVLQMKERFLSFILAVMEGIDKVAGKIPGLKNVSADVLSSLRNAISETRKDFDALADEGIQKAQDKQKELNAEFEGTNQSLEEILKTLPQYSAEAERTSEAVKKAFDEQISAVKDLRKEVEDVYKDIQKAHEQYIKESKREELSFQDSIVGMVADAKNDIQALEAKKTKAIQEGNDKEVANLQEQINQKRSIINTYQSWNLNLENDIAERIRYLAMNELEQLKFDYDKKRIMREVAFLEEEIERTKTLIAKQEAYSKAVALIGAEKMEAINAEIEKTKTFKEKLAEKTSALSGWMANSITAYRGYVSSINSILSQIQAPTPSYGYSPYIAPRQFGGFIPKTGTYMLHAGEYVVPRSGSGGMVVNINGGTYLSEEAAELMGDLIIRKLKANRRL